MHPNFELLEIFRERERAGVALCWSRGGELRGWLSTEAMEGDSTVQTFGSLVKGFPTFDLFIY
jgi:hypothetical protein